MDMPLGGEEFSAGFCCSIERITGSLYGACVNSFPIIAIGYGVAIGLRQCFEGGNFIGFAYYCHQISSRKAVIGDEDRVKPLQLTIFCHPDTSSPWRDP